MLLTAGEITRKCEVWTGLVAHKSLSMHHWPGWHLELLNCFSITVFPGFPCRKNFKVFPQLFSFQYKVNKIFSKFLSTEVMRTAATDVNSRKTGTDTVDGVFNSSLVSLKFRSGFPFIWQLVISQVLLQLSQEIPSNLKGNAKKECWVF